MLPNEILFFNGQIDGWTDLNRDILRSRSQYEAAGRKAELSHALARLGPLKGSDMCWSRSSCRALRALRTHAADLGFADRAADVPKK